MARIIAFIPVRGGSKSIPLKNIKPFCGKPLIYWNLNALEQVRKIDEIVVATDSREIEEAVKGFNFKKVRIYQRDPKNAQDQSSTESVMLEYMKNAKLPDSDLFILVQATSPLTQAKDFSGALTLLAKGKYDSLLTCVRTKRFFWTGEGKPVNYDFRKRPRRQDFAGMLMENGAFYINTVGRIKKNECRLSGRIAVYEMDEFTAIEIDEEDDWPIAEQVMRKHVLKVNASKAKVDIKLFLTDVDGVLTDAGMYYTENGDELKKFNTRDGMGMALLRRDGIKVGIITSEKTKIVERRAQKLKLDYLVQGAVDKLAEAENICRQEGVGLENVAYIGDDINDKELLGKVGLAACPQDAQDEIKSIPGIIVLGQKGGFGVVREYAEYIRKK